MSIPHDAIERMKQSHTIFAIARRLGLQVPVGEAFNGTKAISCFNVGAHKNNDKNPALVLMSQNNRFECYVCHIKGDIIEMVMQKLGLDFQEACLWIDPSLPRIEKNTTSLAPVTHERINPSTYLLEKRGITNETANKFGLKVGKDPYQHFDCIIIPLQKGEKYKMLQGPIRFKCKKNETPGQIFKTALPTDESSRVFLMGGELDAIKLWQETKYNAWTTTTGEERFLDAFVKEFSGIEKIYVVYDNDKAGRNGAMEAAKKLGLDRCYLVEIPQACGKDVTDFFMSGKTKADFDELVTNATYLGQISQSFSERLMQHTPKDGIKKALIGFKQIDEQVGGFRYGNTYAIGGVKKSGKSGLALDFVNNLLLQKKNVCYIDTELSTVEVSIRLAAKYFNLPISRIEATIGTPDDLTVRWAKEFEEQLLYAGIDMPDEILTEEAVDIEKVIAKLEEAKRRNFDIVFIDNLTTFSTNPNKYEDGWKALSSALSRVIVLTKQLQLLTFVILHSKNVTLTEMPKNILNEIKKDNPEYIFEKSAPFIGRPTQEDLYGGQAAQSQLSGTMLLWRPYQNYNGLMYAQMSLLILDSFRHSSSGDEIRLTFEGNKQSFIERNSQITKEQSSAASTQDEISFGVN